MAAKIQKWRVIRGKEVVDFFERYVKLADTIVQESYRLVDEYLRLIFNKITPVEKKQVKSWSSDIPFEFYLQSPLNNSNSEVFLTMNPFGSEVFDTNSPTLFIQQKFKSSIIKKQSIQQKLFEHIDECLKRKCRVETDDYVFYDTDTSKEVLDNIKDSSPKFFSVYEQIEILGIDKEQIKLKVEKMLQEIVEISETINEA